MATTPKRWPTNAEWARLDCLALSRLGRRVLLEGLDNVNDPALLRRLAKAMEAFREIEVKLLAVGPKGDR